MYVLGRDAGIVFVRNAEKETTLMDGRMKTQIAVIGSAQRIGRAAVVAGTLAKKNEEEVNLGTQTALVTT